MQIKSVRDSFYAFNDHYQTHADSLVQVCLSHNCVASADRNFQHVTNAPGVGMRVLTFEGAMPEMKRNRMDTLLSASALIQLLPSALPSTKFTKVFFKDFYIFMFVHALFIVLL